MNKRPAEPGAGRNRIRYMLQFIYSHYAEKLTLEDIAGSAASYCFARAVAKYQAIIMLM